MKDERTPVVSAKQDEKEKKITHILQFALIACIAIFVDQLTKAIAFAYIPESPDRWVWVIKNWFGFSHVENDAIAFGFGSGNRPFMIVIMIVTAALIVAIPFAAIRFLRKNPPAQICLAFIEGGAIGNFIDRLFVKNAEGIAVVRDFINVERFGFANCNAADFFITFGAVALFIILLFIGPQSAFPLKKEWREEAKREEKGEKK